MTVSEMLNKNEINENDGNLYPMTYEQLMQTDDEEKKAFLEAVRTEFNATDDMIADMLGISRPQVTKLSNRLNAAGREQAEDRKKQAFYDWVDGKRAEFTGKHLSAGDLTGRDEEPEEDEASNGSLYLYCTLGDAATMLQAMATRDSKRYDISISWRKAVD